MQQNDRIYVLLSRVYAVQALCRRFRIDGVEYVKHMLNVKAVSP
jgi:hypothetical protein